MLSCERRRRSCLLGESLVCESGAGKWRGITTGVPHTIGSWKEERGMVEAWLKMSKGLGQPLEATRRH